MIHSSHDDIVDAMMYSYYTLKQGSRRRSSRAWHIICVCANIVAYMGYVLLAAGLIFMWLLSTGTDPF